jgi:general secretion pathway protein G
MKKHKTKKRYITLIEIMIVMFLIAMITGVVAYNYRGSLDEGKAFKTKTAIERVENVLNLHFAQNPGDGNEIGNWVEIIKNDPTVSKPDSLIKDGWGNNFIVELNNGEIKVRSERYEDYSNRTQTRFKN